MRRFAAFLALLFLVLPVAVSAASLDARSVRPIPLQSIAAEAFRDPSSAVTIDDILAKRAPPFVESSAVPTWPDTHAPTVMWLRLHLAGLDDMTDWTLRYPYLVSRIDAFVQTPQGLDHVSGGYDLGAADEGLTPASIVVPDPAVRGATLYLRISSAVDPRTVVTLVPVQTAVRYALQRRGLFGFFVGFFIAIAAFNLFMYASLRDRSLLNYAGVMILGALRLAITFGVFWQVLPPLTFIQREVIYDTVALGELLALAAFSVAFLRLTKDRRALVVVAVGVLCQMSVFVTDTFPDPNLAYQWTFVASMLYYASLIYAGVRAGRSGMRVAPIFTAGLVCTAVGYAINMTSSFWPRPDLFVYAIDAGTAAQAVLLALAVARNVQESRAETERLIAASRQLEELALRDALTGVFNRRAFDARLAEATAHALATGASVGILLIDIDRFKLYNDRLGHQAGDDALRLIALACSACVRTRDIFARYGGEEFAAIVPEATIGDLRAIADRMRATVASICLSHADGTPVTISVGGSSGVLRKATDVYAIVREADSALYRAKNDGRDRVVLV